MQRSRIIVIGRMMIDDAEKMIGGDDTRFNTLLRIGNEMVRIGLPFNKKTLKDFAYQDLLFINSYVKLVETKRNSAELIL